MLYEVITDRPVGGAEGDELRVATGAVLDRGERGLVGAGLIRAAVEGRGGGAGGAEHQEDDGEEAADP